MRPVASANSASWRGLLRQQRERLFHKHVLAREKEFAAQGKVALGGRDENRRIGLGREPPVIAGQMRIRNSQLPRALQPPGVQFTDEKLHRQRMEHAQMVGAPPPDADQQ